jgi:hypothetical protein
LLEVRVRDLDFSTFALCIADSTGTPGKKRKEVGLMRMVASSVF